jgi:glycoside hydrolase-like protein
MMIHFMRRMRRSQTALILLLSLVSTPSVHAQAPPLYNVGVSKHIGFHKYAVGTTAQMQQWWNSSPYFDVGFYANGAANHTTPDPNLTAGWVATVSGYGWGLIPIWVGEQAPCGCLPNTGDYPSCRLFRKTFDWDPNVARFEGALEAGLMHFSLGPASAGGLGLSGTVAYFDMEYYNSTSTCDPNNTNSTCPAVASSCGAAATAFLTGWIAGVHGATFKAGVYASPVDAASDFVGISTVPPDDVWLSAANTAYNLVTVWGIGHGLADSALPSSLRLRQYTVTPCCDETWGGVTFNIDKDIEDGQIVIGNGSKTYTFTTQKEDVAGAYSTQPWAINAGTPSVIGDIVGYYLDSNINSHGFYDLSATPVGFDCAGAVSTSAYGINNLQTIVGGYVTNPYTITDSSTTSAAPAPR